MKAIADVFVNLNLHAPDPARWSQEAFVDGVWEKSVAKGFRNLLGHRLGNLEQGRLKLLDLIVCARFPQLQAYKIQTIHIGGTKQDLGLIARLFIDGSSITWQTQQKLPDGSSISDPPLTDCYVANGKPLQLSEEGVSGAR
ncbi:hypothetical protein NliqN6_3644 [Naganishia liquefaciens]|uniref:Uncharacterized protein n=1 Tax=Naganishia liquefaciens TaxID=104408 RepID=A0A8H3TU68_9TREE|nr:hypothetical protein NliqN6_3644 [Naganishia liquefaciens]